METLTILLSIGALSPILIIVMEYFQTKKFQERTLAEHRQNLHEKLDSLRAERSRLESEIDTTKSIDALLGTIEKFKAAKHF